MFSNPEQFTSATKSLFASQIPTFHALGSKTIEGVEKAIALNVAAANASVEQSIAVALFKSAFGNASAGHEQLTKVSKQAVETVEFRVIEATEQFSQNVEEAAPKAGRN